MRIKLLLFSILETFLIFLLSAHSCVSALVFCRDYYGLNYFLILPKDSFVYFLLVFTALLFIALYSFFDFKRLQTRKFIDSCLYCKK